MKYNPTSVISQIYTSRRAFPRLQMTFLKVTPRKYRRVFVLHVSAKMVHIHHLQVPNVGSKRPLLACDTCCKYSMETSCDLVKGQVRQRCFEFVHKPTARVRNRTRQSS